MLSVLGFLGMSHVPLRFYSQRTSDDTMMRSRKKIAQAKGDVTQGQGGSNLWRWQQWTKR
jgi:hypothetical protein